MRPGSEVPEGVGLDVVDVRVKKEIEGPRLKSKMSEETSLSTFAYADSSSKRLWMNPAGVIGM